VKAIFEKIAMTDSGVVEVYEILRVIVCGLVDRPEHVEIVIVPRSSGILFRVNVAPDDYGKVIGVGGRLARPIRAIILAVSLKHKQACQIDFVSPTTGPASGNLIKHATYL
jgi:hypothetical protein